jgi:hypothetical protein
MWSGGPVVKSAACAGRRLASFVLPSGPMRYRRLTLLIALYVTLDLTNPFVGCVFNFNTEESMDGVSRQHERLLRQTAAVVLPTSSGGEGAGPTRPTLSQPIRPRALGEWLVQLRQTHAPQSDPQSPTEDH